MRLTVRELSTGILAVALAATSACAPPTPASPTYTKDVAPIFEAHCTRCHGATLQGDPNPATTTGVPHLCHFNFYDGDPAICNLDGEAPPGSCMGAHSCAELAAAYITGMPIPMPPPPASKLSDREIEVITVWSKEKPPAP